MFPCHYIDQIQLLHLITTESKFSTPSSGRSARIECVAVRAGALAQLPAGVSAAARSRSLSSPRRIPAGSQSLVIPALSLLLSSV